MLRSSLDLDRAFDSLIKRSYPYLIFPPQDFRDALAQQLDSFCQYYRERNDTAFTDRIEIINRILNEAVFDDLTELKIYYFECQQKSIDECFRKIEERLSKLENIDRSVTKSGRPKKEKVNESNNRIEQPKNEVQDRITKVIEANETSEELIPQKVTDVPVGATKNQDKSESTAHNNRDIVRSCIRSSEVPLTSSDISNKTGLPIDKVTIAVYGILTTEDKIHINKDYVIREAAYGNTIRNLRFATYSWKEYE